MWNHASIIGVELAWEVLLMTEPTEDEILVKAPLCRRFPSRRLFEPSARAAEIREDLSRVKEPLQ
jgi:hypothetical protein